MSAATECVSQGTASKNATGFALGALGVVIFGGTLPATKLAVAALDPVFVTAGRALVAGIMAALTLFILRRPLPKQSDWKAILWGSLLLVGGFPFFASIALRTSEASHGGVVLAVLPLATAAAATLIAKERLSIGFWIWATLGSLAVFAFVLTKSEGSWTWADALFLIAALCAAFGYALSGTLARTMPGWEVICWQLVIALPITLIVSLASWQSVDTISIPMSAWVGFAYVSLFSMFLGFFAWNAGLALGGVAKVGQLQLLQVFVTLVLSALALGEKVDPVTIGFAIFVVMTVAFARGTGTKVKK